MNQEILSLRKNSPEFNRALMTGELVRHGETWWSLPREVIWKGREIESVIFEAFSPRSINRPSWVKILWVAIRPQSLTFTLTPCAVLSVYGFYMGWSFTGIQSFLAALGVVLFQVSVNVLNDVEDHLRLVDLPGSQRGSGVIQRGWITAEKFRKWGVLALILGIACGLPSVIQSPQVLLWVGGAGILGVLSHSGRPLGLKYRVLGDFSLFILMGPLLCFGFYQAAFCRAGANELNESVLLIGVFFGLLASCVSWIRQLQTVDLDRIHHFSNLAAVLGFKKTRHWIAFVYGLAGIVLGLFLFSQGPYRVFWGIGIGLGVWPILRLMQKVYRASGPISPLLTQTHLEALRVHFGMGVLVGTGFLILGLYRTFFFHFS